MTRPSLSRSRLSSQGLAYSLSFDGITDRAASVADAGFTGSAAISMMGTFKVTKLTIASGAGLVAAGTLSAPSAGAGPLIAVVDNNVMQAPFIFASNIPFYKCPVDQWFHVAATYAGGTNGEFKIYIGGTLIYTGTITGAAASGPVSIGAVYVSGLGGYIYQKMKVCGFGIYSDVLTQDEIRENHANKVYPTDNAVGIYCFTEGSGTTINDYSGNGRHLIVGAGSPVWSASDLPIVARSSASSRSAASARSSA